MKCNEKGHTGLQLRTVYITNPEISINVNAHHLNFRSKGKLIGKLPLIATKQIVIMEGVMITCGALEECLNMDIPIIFLKRNGSLNGHLLGNRHHDASIRLLQYNAYSNPTTRLQIAKKIVESKLCNSSAILKKYVYNHHEKSEISEIAHKITEYQQKIQKLDSIHEIRGIEGISAKEYFSVFGSLIRKTFTFSGRNRQPPKDPVNAMLSLGYTVITQEIASILEASGIDSYIGFLHEIKSGRPSLALDLIEPLRIALIDKFVISSINLGKFSFEDFQKEPSSDGGVLFNIDGRKKFFSEYEKWMSNCTKDISDQLCSPRRIIEIECEKFRQMLITSDIEKWTPLTLN